MNAKILCIVTSFVLSCSVQLVIGTFAEKIKSTESMESETMERVQEIINGSSESVESDEMQKLENSMKNLGEEVEKLIDRVQHVNQRKTKVRSAVCLAEPDPNAPGNQRVTGVITLTESATQSNILAIETKLGGFDKTDGERLHAFHVHEIGNIAGGCAGAGSHYNPLDKAHGSPHDPWDTRHAGDFPPLEEDENGGVHGKFETSGSLRGEFSIAGRSIVIHEREDDFGKEENEESPKTGNAGARLACCTIAIVADIEIDRD